MIKEQVKYKIIDELFARFKLIQSGTPKKLTLGQNIEQQTIGEELYNVAIDVRYESTWRKHKKYLNFDASQTFEESKVSLSEFSKNDQYGFRDYVNSIRKGIIDLANEYSKPNNHRKVY